MLSVALTAYPPNSNVNVSNLIKFPDVGFSVGINNLATYRSTGKFVAEKTGLYLISVAIASATGAAGYYIMKNNTEISKTEIGYFTTYGYWHTGTVVVSVQLELNDYIWIKPNKPWHMEGHRWSQLSIVKLK